MLVRELVEELQACEQDKEVLALFDPATYLAACQGGEVLVEILVVFDDEGNAVDRGSVILSLGGEVE